MKNKKAMPVGRQAFTLIELLVAMAVFTVVITVVFGLFSTALKGQRRVIALQNIQENGRFLLEFMAKELRMSKINTANGISATLNITRSDDNTVIYTLSNGKIYRNSIQVNSDEVNINGSFYINGVGADGIQPKVTISLTLQGVGNRAEEQAIINIQTTLSQRFLDGSDL